jgi:hypothetical protein
MSPSFFSVAWGEPCDAHFSDETTVSVIENADAEIHHAKAQSRKGKRLKFLTRAMREC